MEYPADIQNISSDSLFTHTHTHTHTEQPVLDAFTVSDDGVDIETPNNVLTINGSLLTISCTAHGVPRPILTWTRDGEVIGDDLITRTIPETYTISESVTIESVTAEDSGLYVCEATNRAGNRTSSTQLEVLSQSLSLSLVLCVLTLAAVLKTLSHSLLSSSRGSEFSCRF